MHKTQTFGILIIFISCLIGCSTQHLSAIRSSTLMKNVNLRRDFQPYFDQCGVNGTIAIYDVKQNRWIVSDTIGLQEETLPASTFKIINLVIALESNIIKDEHDIIKWIGSTDTVKYGYRPDIYHDMSVAEAFETSAGWVFVEMAKKIGKKEYMKYLSKCDYGNLDLSQNDADFWNFGDFAISPKNQVEFLLRLYTGDLPFSPKNIEIVKKVMIAEQTNNYTLRAKTGWTRENNINTGWWTGYIENKNGAYIFATRLLQDRKFNRSDFGRCRKDITLQVFKTLGIID